MTDVPATHIIGLMIAGTTCWLIFLAIIFWAL